MAINTFLSLVCVPNIIGTIIYIDHFTVVYRLPEAWKSTVQFCRPEALSSYTTLQQNYSSKGNLTLYCLCTLFHYTIGRVIFSTAYILSLYNGASCYRIETVKKMASKDV